MLLSQLELKQPVTDILRVLQLNDLLLEDFDWNTIAGATEIISPFEEATTDQFYPSISKVIPCVKIIQQKLSELISLECNPWLLNLLNVSTPTVIII
jgi:hypothetical protein